MNIPLISNLLTRLSTLLPPPPINTPSPQFTLHTHLPLVTKKTSAVITTTALEKELLSARIVPVHFSRHLKELTVQEICKRVTRDWGTVWLAVKSFSPLSCKR